MFGVPLIEFNHSNGRAVTVALGGTSQEIQLREEPIAECAAVTGKKPIEEIATTLVKAAEAWRLRLALSNPGNW